MKKVLTGALLLAAVLTTSKQYAQTIQATIKAGGFPNSVIVAIKPSVAITASATSGKISTFYFTVAVPATVTPKPTVTIVNNFNTNIAYTPESPAATEIINGVAHYVYNFLGDGSQTAGVERDYPVQDNNMVELGFNGGPLTTSTVRLVSIADGGTTSNSFFNIYDAGNDRTNVTAMFYGGTPVNSPAGYNGTSFTSLANVGLPVKFLSFYAIKSGDLAKLNWSVSGDKNNSHFIIERSGDGRNFTELARVEALNNGSDNNTYETLDAKIAAVGTKTVWYRIIQFDKNGEKTFSEIRSISLTAKGLGLSLFPNPVATSTKLVIDAPEAGKASVIVRDARGRDVQQLSLQLVKGINQQLINVATLPAGEYNVTVVGANINQTIKLSKVN